MTTEELIVQLRAADPGGQGTVLLHHADLDEDFVLSEVRGNGGRVMLYIATPCLLCRQASADTGDSWDGFCPSCADRVSDCMDERNLDRAEALELLRMEQG